MKVVMIVELVKVLLSLVTGTYQDDDFYSYLEQAEFIKDGIMDYSKITGRSGPIAYPALSSYLHVFMLNKYLTNDMQYYMPARIICSVSHLITMYFLVKIYQLAFKDKPGYANLVLVLCFSFISIQASADKIFNDTYTTMFCVIAIFLYQRHQHVLGTLTMSIALGVKMNPIMHIPAIYLITSRSRGIIVGTLHIVAIIGLQYVYAYPFIDTPEKFESYVDRAFNIGRTYGHGHNFHWRFLLPVIMATFVFNFTLLLIQAGLLLYFLLNKWMKFRDSFRELSIWPLRILPKFQKQEPFYVAEVFFVCNFIGMVCSRGVFFQYVIWFWFSYPFMLYNGPMKFYRLSAKHLICIM